MRCVRTDPFLCSGQKNAANIHAPRKNGCIINEGAKVSPEENRKRKEENQRIYGLTQEQVDAIVLPVASESADAAAAPTDANDEQRAVASAERRLAALVATRNARAAARVMPVNEWNAEHSLQPKAVQTAAATETIDLDADVAIE